MCGLFGWSFKRRTRGIGQAQKEVIATTLAVANSLRGDHSWGYYGLDRNGQAVLHRAVGDIARADGISALAAMPILMAHTRHATTGAITRENAHPFTIGRIVLAHNGVVFNHAELNRVWERKCSVDSQHFAHHLDRGMPFSDIDAYGALEWFDAAEPRVARLCRLTGGELHVWGVKGAKDKRVGIVWSSDEDHLKSALGAARVECFPYEPLEAGAIYEAREGRLFRSPAPTLTLASPRPRWDLDHWQGVTSGRGGWGSTDSDRDDDGYEGWFQTWLREGREEQLRAANEEEGPPDPGAVSYRETADRARDLGLTFLDAGLWADGNGTLMDAEAVNAMWEQFQIEDASTLGENDAADAN